MGKEYDLIYELGRGNWLDAVAGEAVVLGFILRRPELEARGTKLAEMIGQIPYDSEVFFKVQAEAKAVEALTAKVRGERNQTIFIDDYFVGKDSEHRSDYDWEYNLMVVEGVYQIWMVLPFYLYSGDAVITEKRKAAAEKAVRSFYADPGFVHYRRTDKEDTFSHQVFKTTCFYDEKGRLLRRIIDHDHEGTNKRGHQDIFYFPDYSTAIDAWIAMKKIVTSDRK